MKDVEVRLEELRRVIDDLDARLVELLNERSRTVAAIGALKRALGRAVYDPAREAQVLGQAVAANGGPLSPEAVRRLFERILDESRRLERLAHSGEE